MHSVDCAIRTQDKFDAGSKHEINIVYVHWGLLIVAVFCMYQQ
jgi:hypothetical protein